MVHVADTTDASLLSIKHAELLSTKWWSIEEFRRQGVPCQEGLFTQAETDRINDTIHEYQEAQNLSQEDIDDIIFGAVKQQGFWSLLMRAVPLRRVREWTDLDDSRLVQQTTTRFVKDKLSWNQIGNNLQCTGDECRSRYHTHLAHAETQHEDLNEKALMAHTTKTFWREVSKKMDNTRTAKQCSNKWNDSLSLKAKSIRRPLRWRESDSVASLDLDAEDEIIWDDIIDERWKGWMGQKLHEKWIALRKKNNMLGATHRGEYTAYFAEGLIPHMAPEMLYYKYRKTAYLSEMIIPSVTFVIRTLGFSRRVQVDGRPGLTTSTPPWDIMGPSAGWTPVTLRRRWVPPGLNGCRIDTVGLGVALAISCLGMWSPSQGRWETLWPQFYPPPWYHRT
ncbi:hypothetical protein BJY52DRAFT_1221186 [Lactarius psammicola]|nr:hypothetical protein BJY52DRAFT_1221186 [Lactarius psammicola]